MPLYSMQTDVIHSPFLKLPEDMLLHIMRFANPCDIIALRKCFPKAVGVSRERGAWVGLMRELCRDYKVFGPTYPVDYMVMSAKEIELAVLSSELMNRRLERELLVGGALPRSRRIVHLPGGRVQYAHLTTGGRFVVVVTEDEEVYSRTRPRGGYLSLLDLGYRGADGQRSPSIYTIHTPTISCFCGNVRTIEHGDELLVAIEGEDTADYERRLDVYQISPFAEECFKHVAKFRTGDVSSDFILEDFTGSKAHFGSEDEVSHMIWDCQRDKLGVFELDDPEFELLPVNDDILMHNHSKGLTFVLPDPDSDTDNDDSIHLETAHLPPRRTQDGDLGLWLPVATRDQTTAEHVYSFPRNGTGNVRRHALRRCAGDEWDIVSAGSFRLDGVSWNHVEAPLALAPLRKDSKDSVLVIFKDGKNIRAAVAPAEGDQVDEAKTPAYRTGLLCEAGENIDPGCFMFDVVSGRACGVTATAGELVLLDYLDRRQI